MICFLKHRPLMEKMSLKKLIQQNKSKVQDAREDFLMGNGLGALFLKY